MQDQSHLDSKYFIDKSIYNCPFCNRRHVSFTLAWAFYFDWSDAKRCSGIIARCDSCKKSSLHLSFTELARIYLVGSKPQFEFSDGLSDDLDACIFYSVPTSFFVVDSRIPAIIRELITEAEGCLKMNFLTGASACIRKAIYELLELEKSPESDYEAKIKGLKKKYPDSDPNLFDILAHIQNMTSDKVHEQSWEKWDSNNLRLLIETLKTVLHDIYVLPAQKKERAAVIQKLKQQVSSARIGEKQREKPASP